MSYKDDFNKEFDKQFNSILDILFALLQYDMPEHFIKESTTEVLYNNNSNIRIVYDSDTDAYEIEYQNSIYFDKWVSELIAVLNKLIELNTIYSTLNPTTEEMNYYSLYQKLGGGI